MNGIGFHYYSRLVLRVIPTRRRASPTRRRAIHTRRRAARLSSTCSRACIGWRIEAATALGMHATCLPSTIIISINNTVATIATPTCFQFAVFLRSLHVSLVVAR